MTSITAKKHKVFTQSWGGGDYSQCSVDSCPYLATGTIDSHLIEIDKIPEYPDTLLLGHEQVCNYHCTFCSSRPGYSTEPQEIQNAGYENIYEKLKPVLPHIKRISANGNGELFASPHILKMLAEWKPLAPVEECSASLETNGSLFDAEHWAKISNLGQYNLRVAITVTSFDDYTYKLLSGTTLPVQQVIDNLHFVKSLKEQGIVNHLQIATVVQERNFFQMPEFTRRCIEEFGADSVRLRPYQIHGSEDSARIWFTEMRNPNHPYHEEYLKVMQDPIFKHPKVSDWGLNTESHTPDLLTFLMQRDKKKVVKFALKELAKWPFRKSKRLLGKLIGR
ncbi:MAG: radical SAM protein [Synergistaceae bacterium]|nr:radical SAM protein [Synergistaceae bacterium]